MLSALAPLTPFFPGLACVLAFGLVASSARAAEAPSAANRDQPRNQFQLIVVPTTQYACDDIWNRTPNGRGPAFSAADQVVREQQVHFVVLAVNYAISAEGQAEVNYRITFRQPNASPGQQTDLLQLIPRQSAEDGRLIRKAHQSVGFAAGKTDPLGEWTAVVEATDVVGRVTARVEKKITVVGDEQLAAPLPADIEPGRWMMTYYQKPAPHQLIPVMELFIAKTAADPRAQRLTENGSWLGFFEQVMKDNPWLLPHVVARLERATGAERDVIAASLAYAKRDDRAFMKSLSTTATSALAPHQTTRWPVPGKEMLQGAQLDVLWGRFFASGRYEPIRELAGVLAYHPYRNAMEDYKKLTTKPRRPPPEVLKSAVFGALAWSLTSNIQRDKVVRDYCEGILLRKELPAKEHDVLVAIFNQALAARKKSAEPTGPEAPPR